MNKEFEKLLNDPRANDPSSIGGMYREAYLPKKYTVEWTDGKKYNVELPPGVPSNMAAQYVQQMYYPKIEKPLQTPDEGPSALGVAARAVGRNIIPAVAGSLGFFATAPLGLPAGGIGSIATGTAGAYGAATLAEKAQEAFLESHPDIAKTLGQDKETRAADEAAHGTVNTLATVGTNLVGGGFRPSVGGIKSLVGLGEQSLGNAWRQAGVGAGVMGGINAAEQGISDQPFDPYSLGLNALIGGTFHTETGIGRRLRGVGEGFTRKVTPTQFHKNLFPEYAVPSTPIKNENLEQPPEPTKRVPISHVDAQGNEYPTHEEVAANEQNLTGAEDILGQRFVEENEPPPAAPAVVPPVPTERTPAPLPQAAESVPSNVAPAPLPQAAESVPSNVAPATVEPVKVESPAVQLKEWKEWKEQLASQEKPVDLIEEAKGVLGQATTGTKMSPSVLLSELQKVNPDLKLSEAKKIHDQLVSEGMIIKDPNATGAVKPWVTAEQPLRAVEASETAPAHYEPVHETDEARKERETREYEEYEERQAEYYQDKFGVPPDEKTDKKYDEEHSYERQKEDRELFEPVRSSSEQKSEDEIPYDIPEQKPIESLKATDDQKQEILDNIAKVANPTAVKHIPKEKFKIRRATQFIGEGTPNSSTDRYGKLYDKYNLANTGNYDSSDLIYVSSNGNRDKRVSPVVNGQLRGAYENIEKAIAAKAHFIMDTAANLKNTAFYNLGEIELANYLAGRNYDRDDITGIWSPNKFARLSYKVPTIESSPKPPVFPSVRSVEAVPGLLDALRTVKRGDVIHTVDGEFLVTGHRYESYATATENTGRGSFVTRNPSSGLGVGHHVDVNKRFIEGEWSNGAKATYTEKELFRLMAPRVQKGKLTPVGKIYRVSPINERSLEVQVPDEYTPTSGNIPTSKRVVKPSYPNTTVEDITKALRAVFGIHTDRLLKSGFLNVLPTEKGTMRAAFYDPVRNKVFIIADQFDPKNTKFVKGVMLHEIGVHAGMESMLGKELFQKILDRIEQGIKNKEPAFVNLDKRIPSSTPEFLVPEERLGYLVTKHPELPLVKQILSNIKTWLWRKAGVNFELNADDLRTLAVSSLKRVSRLAEEGRLHEINNSLSERERIQATALRAEEANNKLAELTAQQNTERAMHIEAPPEPNDTEAAVQNIRAGMANNEEAKVGSESFLGKFKEATKLLRERPYARMIELFQDYRKRLTDLQKTLELKHGKKFVIENGLNIGDASTNKPSIGVRPAVNKLKDQYRNSVLDYAKLVGMKWSEVLADMKMWSLGITEPTLRDYLWRMRVPLSTEKMRLSNGSEMSPADFRQKIVDLLNSGRDLTTPDANGRTVADHLRDQLNYITGRRFLDPEGHSPDEQVMAVKTLDKNDPVYNVVGPWDQQILQGFRDHLETARAHSPEASELIDRIFASEKALRDKVTEIDRAAGTWGQHTDNWVKFARQVDENGNSTFFTLKGDKVRQDFDRYTGSSVNKELNRIVQAREGRSTESDNPMTQTLADADVALKRLDRRDFIESLYNLVKKHMIPGAKIIGGPIEVGERNENIFQTMNQDNIVFHPRPDGKLDVIYLSDPQWRDAIKGTINPQNALLRFTGMSTRGMTSLFTRYNIAFGMGNAVRHGATNFWNIMAGEYGPVAAARVVNRTLTQALLGSPIKAARASHLISTDNIEKLGELGKKDSFYKNLHEWITIGGKQTFDRAYDTNDAATRSIMESFEKKPVARTFDQIKTVFDTFNNIFEFMNREAAYDTIKKANIKLGMTEAHAAESASAYTKNLLNLEKGGKYSQAMGSWFPLFKAEATGAARQIDAIIAPIFQSADSFLKANWTRGMGQNVHSALERLGTIKETEKLGIKTDPAVIKQLEQIIYSDPGVKKLMENYNVLRRNAALTAAASIGFGYLMYNQARIMAHKDEEGRNEIAADDHRLWVRSLRIPTSVFGDDASKYFGKENKFISIPWGFGGGGLAAIGSQMAALNNNDIGAGDAVMNMAVAAKQSFLPLPVASLEMFKKNPMGWAIISGAPGAVRPMLEYAFNMDDFARQIRNPRPSRYSELGNETTGEEFKGLADWIAKTTNGAWMPNPDELQFAASQYTQGLSILGNSVTHNYEWMTGKDEFDPKKAIPFISTFLARKSDVDARDYSEINDKLTKNKKILETFEARGFDEAYDKYVDKHPEAETLRQAYINNTQQLNQINAQMNKIRAENQSPKDRRDELQDLKETKQMIMRDMVDTYKMADF